MHELYGYQIEGAQWLRDHTRAMLADEPGLGKTAQTIAALVTPALIVCPAVVKSVWESEIAKWRPKLRAQVLYSKDQPNFRLFDVVIVNYDILPGQPTDWAGVRLGTLVADEAHMLKSYKAKRTKSFRSLTRTADRVWLLTGTPMLGTPEDLKGVLVSGGLFREAFFDAEGGSDYDNFVKLFRGRELRFGGYSWGQPDPEVNNRMKRVMLRRTKDEVGLQLPEKSYQEIKVELSKDLTGEHRSALENLDLENLPDEIGKFAELRAKTALAKTKATLSLIEQYEAAQEPILVFCAHTAPLDIIAERKGWAKLDGSTDEKKRGALVEKFQRGELRGLACNIKAAGVGITLTRASTALFIDQEWTPALNEQAECRIHRIGQKNACNYVHLVADTELEKVVFGVLRKKQRLISAAIDGVQS